MTTDAAVDESRMFLNTSIDQMEQVEHWLAICPFLTLHGSSLRDAGSLSARPLLPQVRKGLVAPASASLCDKGFFRCTREQLEISTPCSLQRLSSGAMQLMRHGYSPLFLLMFDEAWELSESISTFVQAVTGLRPIGDYYVFCVEAALKNSRRSRHAFDNRYSPGPPHRDRPLAGMHSFSSRCLQNSTIPALYPHYVSTWFALSHADTDNSCLCFIERRLDPGYYLEGDAFEEHSIKLSSVVSQPLQAGGLLSFSHRVLHWGSKLETSVEEDGLPAPPAAVPRIALTTAFADGSFEEPYFDHSVHSPTCPPLGLRLGLACGQQIQYAHMAGLGKHELALLNRVFRAQKGYFNVTYYDKICSSSQMQMFLHRQQGGKKE